MHKFTQIFCMCLASVSMVACSEKIDTDKTEVASAEQLNIFEIKGKQAEKELLIASEKNDLEKVKALLSTTDIPNFEDTTPLIWAAKEGHTQVVKALLAVGVNVDQRYDGDDTGSTALMWAVAKKHVDIVKLLLGAGADVNATPMYVYPALLDATKIGDQEILKLLLASGANVNIKDDEGNTALKLAQETGNEDIVKLLKSAGAKE